MWFEDQEEAKHLSKCVQCVKNRFFSPPTFLQGTLFTGSLGPAGPPVSVFTVHIIVSVLTRLCLPPVRVHPFILSQGMTGPPGVTGPQGPRGDPGEIVRTPRRGAGHRVGVGPAR